MKFNFEGDPAAYYCQFNDSLLNCNKQPRSQGLFPGLRAEREKTLASAGHVSTLHPEILGAIN